jgi:hypothetical protein
VFQGVGVLCWSPPDALSILMHLAHAMKWNVMRLSVGISELERIRFVGGEFNVSKWHNDDDAQHSVEVADFEICPSEFRVPPDSIKKVTDWSHHCNVIDDLFSGIEVSAFSRFKKHLYWR